MADYVLKNSIHTVVGETILADIRSQRSSYYFFVGGLQVPGVTYSTAADPSYNYELETRNGIVTMKRVLSSDVSFVVPRIDWVSGTVYDYYDDYTTSFPSHSGATDISTAQFYVVNSAYNVYKCLSNNINAPSTVEPTSTLAAAFTTSDGYRWKYMYAIPLSLRNRFLNSAYMPVQTALSDQFYSAGQLTNTAIIAPGTGYTHATILIDGDGTGALLTPVISNGQIVQVLVTTAGSGYTYANLTVEGDGTGASIVSDLSTGDLNTSQADVELLAVAGSIEAYRITNQGNGYAATGVPSVGVGDGVSTDYQLADNSETVSNAINPILSKTTPVFGTELLYTTPRYNLVPNSTVIDQGALGWNSYYGGIPNATYHLTDPLGGNTAISWPFQDSIDDATNSVSGIFATLPDGTAPNAPKVGDLLTVSVWLKSDAPIWIHFGIDDGAGLNINLPQVWTKYTFSATFSDEGRVFQLTVGNYGGDNSNIGNSGSNRIYVAFPQCEAGAVATSYMPTAGLSSYNSDGSNKKVTDYSITADGRVTFGTAPKTTQTTTWAGHYTFNGANVAVTAAPVVALSSIVLPTVTIEGDGTGASGHVTISNGNITSIVVDKPGQGYTFAKVTVNGNGEFATAVPVISPWGGHGKDAINELYATRLSFFSNLLNDTNQGLTISNQFRQIGLLRNPRKYGNDQYYTSLGASGVMKIVFGGTAPSLDDILEEQNTGNQFQVIQVSGTTMLVQNIDNFDLQGNSILLNTNTGVQVSAVTVSNPDIDKYSGDLMFIDNFSINQQAGQQIIIFKTTLKF